MLEVLTPREREIFDLLLEGISPKEIAFKLNITHATVSFHRAKLYDKLGVHSIQELFAKYSTNGKAPPSEAIESEATAPVSPTNKKKLKILLPVGITLVALSVVFLSVFVVKSFAHSTPKGEIIQVQYLGFRPTSDEGVGGNSTSEVFISKEEINGITIDSVLNIKTNLAKRENSDTIFSNARTDKHYIIQQLRQANGIRFKARGDGKSWSVGFHTKETTALTNYAQYRYDFGTVRDQVIVVDIPYSNLFLPEWSKQYSFNFNKETINTLTIEALLAVQNYGSSSLQIFDFEIY